MDARASWPSSCSMFVNLSPGIPSWLALRALPSATPGCVTPSFYRTIYDLRTSRRSDAGRNGACLWSRCVAMRASGSTHSKLHSRAAVHAAIKKKKRAGSMKADPSLGQVLESSAVPHAHEIGALACIRVARVAHLHAAPDSGMQALAGRREAEVEPAARWVSPARWSC